MSTRLRTGLIVVLLILQAVTVGLVLVVTGNATRDLLVDEMRDTLTIASENLATRTADHLDPAEQAAVLGARLLENGTVPLDNQVEQVSFLDAQVAAAPDITGAYIARPDGSFVLVSRDGADVEGGTRVKSITVDGEQRTSRTVQRNEEEVVVDGLEEPTDTYDPRDRLWYQQALADDGVAWTEPYFYAASGDPGVTTAVAARGPDGEVQAVMGVDLSLEDLSEFIGTTEVSPSSRALLVDLDGIVVASDDPSQVSTTGPDGEQRRVDVDELDDDIVRGTVRSTDGSSAAAVGSFSVDGQAWQASATPLDGREPWVASVMAPEDEFVNEVVDEQLRVALIAIGIGLGVVVLALPAVALLARRIERVHERGSTDALTGLANRRRFEELLEAQLAVAEQKARPLSVAMIDVDLFKGINDTHGHAAGDDALVAVAGRVRSGLRDHDVVARIGGDEFAAILVDTPVGQAVEVLDRARHAVADEPAMTSKGPVPMSITIGVAEATGTTTDRTSILEAADAALYTAKEAGRNRVATPDGVAERDPIGPSADI